MARKFMRNLRGLVRNAAIVTALSVSLSACVVYPARVAYAGPVVAVAPPAMVVENYGAAPYAGAVWIGGYWGWEGGRHVWHGGYWDHPRPGYYWRPHAWVQVHGGWQMRQGGWVRR
jgi:WXXGXW repeat (2 copies)